MWSRKKRKKEAAAAAAVAGGVVKEGAGSSNGSGPNPAKQMMSDVSRSRSQSGSPMKDPHQQRGGSLGPRGEPSLSLANGALPPKPLPPSIPIAAQQQQQQNLVPGPVMSQTTPTNLKQYPPNHNIIPPIPPQVGGMGTVLPPQLPPHAPVIIPQSEQLQAEAPVPAGAVPPTVHGGGEEIQVKQAYKTVVKSNVKPSLTVPLPTAPLSDNILESLHEVGGNSVATSVRSVDSGNGGLVSSAAVEGQSQSKDPSSTNLAGISGPGSSDTGGLRVGGAGGGVSAPSTATSAQQLQQVIDAQRTRIALLARLVTDQKRRANPQQNIPDTSSSSGGGGLSRVNVSSAPPGRGGRTSTSVVLRTQTFDYGNRSNKVLENAAVQQLEQDYYHGDQNTRKWS